MHKNNERFANWMSACVLSDSDVAEKMKIDKAYIWRIRKGEREIADSFAWKFGQAYGFDLAQRLFSFDKEPA